jgi:hypothetical protein
MARPIRRGCGQSAMGWRWNQADRSAVHGENSWLAQRRWSCLSSFAIQIFLNQTDAFQEKWLRRVTLERVIELADYRFILFKEAVCPCSIAVFTAQKPDEVTHEVEYVAPKVSRADLRDGVITVAPRDRKWIPLRLLLAATEQNAVGVAWKSHLWGTPRDLRFLDYLFSLPRLNELAGSVADSKKGKRRWRRGVGFKPMTSKKEKPKTLRWKPEDRAVSPDLISGLPALPEALTYELGPYLQAGGYPPDQLGREPPEELFTPPLVLWDRGFTDAAFLDTKSGISMHSTVFQDLPRTLTTSCFWRLFCVARSRATSYSILLQLRHRA